MPVSRFLLWAVPVAVVLVPLNVTPAGDAVKPPNATDVEVKYTDDSVMKLKLLDEKLELVTKHGTLQIAVADVRRIDFGGRTPPETAEKIALAISNLGHPDFNVREQASADLKAFRERAYPALLKATKNPDPEVGRRADECVRHISGRVPPNLLEQRESDVIHTDDSKITGRLSTASLRVHTFQFGEQALKLADVRTLKAGNGAFGDEAAAATTAPNNLMAFQNQFGKELAFALTGAQPTGQGSSVWGTDAYTLDSNLSAAAVHSGMVQPGQTAVVRVRIVASPPQFVGTARNGISSSTYGNYPAGAFEFVRK